MAVSLNVRIDEMSEKDLDDVLEIERLSFSQPWSITLFRQELENPYSHSYILKSPTGRAIGYVIFWLIADEGHIMNIAVSPQYRNMGFGSMLLAFTLSKIRESGGSVIRLEVRRNNLIAIALYRKFGFRIAGIRKNYYLSDGEDAIVMEKEILR